MTPEGKIKAKVKRAMERFGDDAYRFMPVQNGMGAPSLDFLYCIKGYFFAIETKAPGKKLTRRQEVTAAVIARAGGHVFMVDGDESLTEAIDIIRHIVG